MTSLARRTQLELRLVTAGPEMEAAQRLRYRVFYEEMGAVATPALRTRGIDGDAFDRVADHLVVVDLDHGTAAGPLVVGCCRMPRQSPEERNGGFDTAQEFDLRGVPVPEGEIMELGRSCIEPGCRTGAVMQLLCRGIGA